MYLCILFLLRCDVRLLSSSTTLYVKLATVVVLCDCERVSTFTFYAAPLSVYNSTGTTRGGGDCCLWLLLYLSSRFNCETRGHNFSFKLLKRQIRFLFFSSPCSINFIYTQCSKPKESYLMTIGTVFGKCILTVIFKHGKY